MVIISLLIFFLTDATIPLYSLRKRPYDHILPNKTGHLSEYTFLIRMLYKDIY